MKKFTGVGIIAIVLMFVCCGVANAEDLNKLSWDAVTEDMEGNAVIVSGYRIYADSGVGDPIVTDVGNVTEIPLADLGLTANTLYNLTADAYINETQAGIVREVARSEQSESIPWIFDLLPQLLKQIQNLIISPPAS